VSALDDIGRRRGAPQSSAGSDLLNRYDELLTGQSVTSIALILKRDAVATANTFAEAFPDATVHLLKATNDLTDDDRAELLPNVRYEFAVSVADRVDCLSGADRPQIIIEHGSNERGQKRSCFRQLFWFVPAGGIYAVEGMQTVHQSKYNKRPGETILEVLTRFRDLTNMPVEERGGVPVVEREFAATIADITFEGTLALVFKSEDHQFKLRDWEADDILTRRRGDAWGSRMITRSAYTYTRPAHASRRTARDRSPRATRSSRFPSSTCVTTATSPVIPGCWSGRATTSCPTPSGTRINDASRTAS
jgi:hypothetical protein